MWPDRRLLDLLGIDLPIIQAPMAGANGSAMAIAVSEAGGLGSLPCAMLDPAKVRAEIGIIRQRTAKPINVNFFCHTPPAPDPQREAAWRVRLGAYYMELGLDPDAAAPAVNRAPFDETTCGIVEDLEPEVVSFHFGLPTRTLLDRVKAAGCLVIGSATTADEARWLAANGCDAIIAQGSEAGGHRGMFLETDVAMQVGTFALVRAISGSVQVPVIAAGGIADGRAIAAALALGACAAQIGSGYLTCRESTISPLHRKALADPGRETAITNVLTGRPARGVVNRFMREQGPIDDAAPNFPLARPAVAPLRAKAESQGSADFSPLWSGQAAILPPAMGAGELTRKLAEKARAISA